MNDFSELEAELKQLRPRAASPELMSRVERALDEPITATATGGVLPRRQRSVNWFALGFGLAAAAALLMLARVSTDRPIATQPTVASIMTPAPRAVTTSESSYVPDGITRVVYNTRNEGLVFPSDSDQPMRRVRSRSRETLHWKDPGTGASIRVSYPTEEIELVPVRGQ
ncbi:MAG: hypothetical protein ACJ8HU_08865 [Chthoniobacterales bacterium]